jgi:phage shock protein PspC (stress-responsive transcriptional regulator)
VSRVVAGLRAFGAFWWDFIVGDDWRIAAGVILALAATFGLARTTIAAWWLLPVVVVAILGLSLWRSTRDVKDD